MGIELAGTTCSSASPAAAAAGCSSSSLKRKAVILICCELGGRAAALTSPFVAGVRPLKARSFDPHSTRRARHRPVRRALTASLDGFPEDDTDELATNLQGEKGLTFPPNSAKSSRANADLSSSPLPPWPPIRPEPPDWSGQIVPADVEKNANSVELPLSLRLIKRKKKRWDDAVLDAGEAARCSVKRAFSSMVFMIREVLSTALHLREALFFEDLQGILARDELVL